MNIRCVRSKVNYKYPLLAYERDKRLKNMSLQTTQFFLNYINYNFEHVLIAEYFFDETNQ